MNALRILVVCFSMDDFGTGYSSLASLRKLPLNQLKIDQTFVRDILTDLDSAIIVETIIAMANKLNIEVIAEGVETEAQPKFSNLESVKLPTYRVKVTNKGAEDTGIVHKPSTTTGITAGSPFKVTPDKVTALAGSALMGRVI